MEIYFFYCFQTIYLLPKDLLGFLKNKHKSYKLSLSSISNHATSENYTVQIRSYLAPIYKSCIFLRKKVRCFDEVLPRLTDSLLFFKNCRTAIKVSFSFFEGFDLEGVVAAVLLELAAMLNLAVGD